MIAVALRVGYGTIRGLRLLWAVWAALALAVVGWEASLGLPGSDLALVTAAFSALPLSLVVHETGHAWAALAVGYRGISLQRSRLSITVCCPQGSPRGDAIVAFGGPLMSLFAAVLMVGAGLGPGLLPASAWLLPPALVVGAGAFSLLPFATDGRTFWTWAWVAVQSGVGLADLRLPGRAR